MKWRLQIEVDGEWVDITEQETDRPLRVTVGLAENDGGGVSEKPGKKGVLVYTEHPHIIDRGE